MRLRLSPPLVITSGDDLLKHLDDYIVWLDENPLTPSKVFNLETMEYNEPAPVPKVGCCTGFCLHLGISTTAFIALRDSYPDAFNQCIETLRSRLLEKATARDFAKLVASRPLLDLQTPVGYNTTTPTNRVQNKA